MEWVKKHADTVLVLGGILGAAIWMNSGLHNLERRISEVKSDLQAEIASVKSELREEIIVIKTVLILKGVMPAELASQKDLECGG
jgi:hypothetical protein